MADRGETTPEITIYTGLPTRESGRDTPGSYLTGYPLSTKGLSMDRRRFVTGTAIVAAATALGCRNDNQIQEDGTESRTTLIDGASVFDVRTGTMQPATSILIKGDRIT